VDIHWLRVEDIKKMNYGNEAVNILAWILVAA
jgi:hypothetical protein